MIKYLSKHRTAFYTMNINKQWNLHQNPAFLILWSVYKNFGRTVWHTCLPAILNQPSNQPLTCLITRIYWSFPMNLRITTNSSQCQLKLPKEIFCNLPSIDLPSFTVHSSLVDYLAQVKNAKNCPTTFYCIFQVVRVPMTTTQNIRVCFLSSDKTLFP